MNLRTLLREIQASTSPLMTHGKAFNGPMSMLKRAMHVKTRAGESVPPVST